jgi:hypothetical protein
MEGTEKGDFAGGTKGFFGLVDFVAGGRALADFEEDELLGLGAGAGISMASAFSIFGAASSAFGAGVGDFREGLEDFKVGWRDFREVLGDFREVLAAFEEGLVVADFSGSFFAEGVFLAVVGVFGVLFGSRDFFPSFFAAFFSAITLKVINWSRVDGIMVIEGRVY